MELQRMPHRVMCRCRANSGGVSPGWHDIGYGKCTGAHWAESLFEYERQSECATCNANSDGVCEVAMGQESLGCCEAYQRMAQKGFYPVYFHPVTSDVVQDDLEAQSAEFDARMDAVLANDSVPYGFVQKTYVSQRLPWLWDLFHLFDSGEIGPGYADAFEYARPGKPRTVYQALTNDVLDAQEYVRDTLGKGFVWPSDKDCLTPHVHKNLLGRHWWLLDLSDAFGHVKFEMVYDALLARNEDVAQFIAQRREMFFHAGDDYDGGGLIQGAPASPILFEIVMRDLVDEPIAVLLKEKQKDLVRHSVVYTRYRDDIAITGTYIPKWFRKRVLKIIRSAALEINEKKTQLVSNMHKDGSVRGVIWLGVIVRGGRTHVPGGFLKALALLYSRHDVLSRDALPIQIGMAGRLLHVRSVGM